MVMKKDEKTKRRNIILVMVKPKQQNVVEIR